MPVTDPRYELTRDLEGYGEHSIDPQWPNGAKICISFLLNYEEGAERTVLNGDAHSEPYCAFSPSSLSRLPIPFTP